jgi:pimeloyl-ACP methyl ester carboxylesterase
VKRVVRAIGAIASGLSLGACFPAPVPMTSVRYDSVSLGPPRCLVVLLPGVFDDAGDFVKGGFVDAIRRSGLSADVIATNATLGYYRKGMMPAQLFVDVVDPARAAKRYEQIWIVGVSMGGLGALMSAQQHATDLAGVIALAPYLGRDETIASIKSAGGLDAWTPPAEAPITEDNFDVQLWRWLKAATNGQVPAPSIYLGWGKRDKFREPDAMLAAKLPQDHVIVTEGGHDWRTWRALLERMLRSSAIAKGCAAR